MEMGKNNLAAEKRNSKCKGKQTDFREKKKKAHKPTLSILMMPDEEKG